MLISIIVCTRDRCDKLTALLNSLSVVRVPDGWKYGVIIVDNGSTDATYEVCKPFLDSPGRTFRYFYEGKKGKSFALNRGIREARGDILAFTDDDCIVDPSWLEVIANEYVADPQLAFQGGRVELYNPEDRSNSTVTFREKIDLSARPDMLFRPTIMGANMSFRREVVTGIGEFDTLLGPGSRHGAVAEDLDYQYRAVRKGFKVVYFPGMVVYHDHGRQTDKEIDAVSYQYSVGRGSFYCKHLFSDVAVIRRLYWDLTWQVRRMVSNLFAGKSTRVGRRTLRALAVGALSRLFG